MAEADGSAYNIGFRFASTSSLTRSPALKPTRKNWLVNGCRTPSGNWRDADHTDLRTCEDGDRYVTALRDRWLPRSSGEQQTELITQPCPFETG